MPSFGARVWATAMTGVPFAIYKMGAGWHLRQQGHEALGTAILAWGALDVLLNLLALAAPERFSFCLLSNLGRSLERRTGLRNGEALLLGIDTLISFGIVVAMIVFGALPLKPRWAEHTWNGAVAVSVLAVGVAQIAAALRRNGGAAGKAPAS